MSTAESSSLDAHPPAGPGNHARPSTAKSSGTTHTGTASGVAAAAIDVVKIYGSGASAVRALDEVRLEIPDGRFTAVMGPSGSGKSTLLHCLAGLDSVTSGTVRLGPIDLTELGDRGLTRVRRDRVGFVFQSFNLLPTLTAEQNITLPLELAGRRVDAAWLTTVVDTLGLAERRRHRPGELSGGQAQRVAIARALVTWPDVIFADEPTGNLDSVAGAEVLAFLRRSVREFERTVVMVTHDPVAASYADRVVLMADGQVAGAIDEPNADAVLDAVRNLGV